MSDAFPTSDAVPTEPVLVLAEVVGLLRSGASPREAWAAVGLGGADHRGTPTVDHPDPVWDAVHAACALAHHAGAPLADVLALVAEHAQVEREAHAAREAAIAGPRLSATVLQWLPAAGLGLGALIDVHALRVLFVTPLGWLLLTLAGGLVWAGRQWMQWLVRDAASASAGTGRDPTAVPVTLVLALVEAAVASGLDVRSAVAAVGQAIGAVQGRVLEHVASALALGDSWQQAWRDVPRPMLVVERALRSAWTAGMAPQALLRASAANLRLEARLASEKALGELAVRMSLPLTLCFLPAFALVGLVPMLVAVASSTALSL